MRICLNIGAGQDIQKSQGDTTWYNLDKCQESGVDIIRDIEKQCLPFADSTVDHILCGDTLEHLHELIYPMNEMWRVLKPNGVLQISTPYGMEETMKHITHRRMFFPSSWVYFDSHDTIFSHMRKADGILADFAIKESKVVDGCHVWAELIARKELSPGFRAIYPSPDLALPNTDSEAIKLDVGCGRNKRKDTPGWIGLDQDLGGSADIVCDLEKGIPFPDKSVDFIFTSHTLEHINNLIFIMEEFWRVLKRDGIIEIIVPHYKSSDAYRHPDHKRFFHEELWNFWNPDIYQDDRDSYGVKARFYIVPGMNYIHENGLFTTLRKVG